MPEARRRQVAIGGVQFHANAVATVLQRGQHRGGGAAERIQHGVAGEREHLHQPRGQFQGEWCGMLPGRGSGDGPELLEPFVELVLGDHAQPALFFGGFAVATRLALHEDELDVILNDGVRLVGLAEKFRAVADLVAGIRDFVPDDRVEVVEPKLAALDANIGMQGHHGMPAVIFLPRQAYVPHHADQPPARHQHAVRFRPDPIQFRQEVIVILDVTHLPLGIIIILERPIGRRGDHQMDRAIRDKGQIAGVALHQPMRGREVINGLLVQHGMLHSC